MHTAGGGSALIGKVAVYSAAPCLAIAQARYAIGKNHERAVLKNYLVSWIWSGQGRCPPYPEAVLQLLQ